MSDDEEERTVTTTRKVIRREERTIERVIDSDVRQYTTTKTAKYFGKTLDELTLDELLEKLTPQELEILENDVDPDDPHLPPHQRCRDQTKKKPTGPLDRKKLLHYLEKYAKEQEDWPEQQPFQLGIKRGKVWIPKELPKPAKHDEIEVQLDLDQEYEVALDNAEEHDLVDLAAILGLHSMLNQDQFHSAQLNKAQKQGDKFDGIVKSTPLKILPPEPDNDTDVEATVKQIAADDPNLVSVNLNNIKNISRETFKKLFEGLKTNTHLKLLSCANTCLTDGPAQVLIEALKENKTLERLNVESNYLTGPTLAALLGALLPNQTVLEFRAANQRPFILGNRVEMEVAKLVLKNKSLIRLGLSLHVPDARIRINNHLQDNYDLYRQKRMGYGR